MESSNQYTLSRKLTAEFVGATMLLAAVVGSGIMGERLAAGNAAIALLANSLATGAALMAIITSLGPISGAHLNPVVSLSVASQGGMPWGNVPGYVVAQLLGAVSGVAIANIMFGLPALFISQHERSSYSEIFSECAATFFLLAMIWGCVRGGSSAVPIAVAAYITSAYWFTSSTSFANPAVTVARSLTDTFAGIRPYDVPAFIGAQLIGGALATNVFRWLGRPTPGGRAEATAVPHHAKGKYGK